MHDDLVQKLKEKMTAEDDECYDPGPVSPNEVSEIELLLKVSLPEDFRFFLMTNGAFGVPGDEIFGIGRSFAPNKSRLVRTTEQFREENNLPHDLIPIKMSLNGDVICLNTSRNAKQTLVVFNLFSETVTVYQHAQTFSEFFKQYLIAAIES